MDSQVTLIGTKPVFFCLESAASKYDVSACQLSCLSVPQSTPILMSLLIPNLSHEIFLQGSLKSQPWSHHWKVWNSQLDDSLEFFPKMCWEAFFLGECIYASAMCFLSQAAPGSLDDWHLLRCGRYDCETFF